jgi:curved DNA-binding protein
MTVAQARELLGVHPGADEVAVAQAYRAAVKAAHPDRDGGDAERLRRVIEANQILSSATSRLTFTLVRRPAEPRQSAQRRLSLQISVEEALFGGERTIQVEGGPRLNVRLPAGLRSGEALRLAGADGGVDVLLQINLATEAGLSVRGSDVLLDAEIDPEALQDGACIELDTPRGRRVFLAPPSAEDGGVVMVRFKGQGLPARGRHAAGDMVIRIASRPSRGLLRRFTGRRAA